MAAPTVTTAAASSIAQTTATGNGNVTSDGGATVTERGVCWGASANPTTGDSKAAAAGTTGTYTASMTPLTESTHFHYRAYATNSVGTSYGADAEFDTLAAPLTAPSTTTPVVIVLDSDDKAVCVLSNAQGGYDGAPCRFWADTHTEDLTGVLTYDFTCESTHADSVYVTDQAPILIRNDDGEFRYLRIVTVDDVREGEKRYKVVHAENAAQELRGRIVRPATYAASSPDTIAAGLLAGSRWEVGEIEDAGSYDIEYREMQSAGEAIGILATTAALEVAFRVTFNGSVITHRYIDMVKRIGQDINVTFEWSKNLRGAKRTSDSIGVITRLLGAGKADDRGNFVTFTNIAWSLAGGDPCDKPAGVDYIDFPDSIERWGIIEGVYNNPDIVSAEALIHATYKAGLLTCEPAVTFEVDPVLLEQMFSRDPSHKAHPYSEERVRLGDGVWAHDPTFDPPLLTMKRVTELVRSYATDTPTIGA